MDNFDKQLQREQETFKKLEQFNKSFGNQYKDAISDLDGRIAKLYAKYAKDNSISYTEALKYLTDNERVEFQRDLKFYLDGIKDPRFLAENRAYLQALSVRVRVKRLEYMKANIVKTGDSLYRELKNSSLDLFTDVYNTTGAGVLSDISDIKSWSGINKQKMETILEFPWSGSNYSQKIWGANSNFVKTLDKILTNGLVTNKPYGQIVKDLERAGLGGSRYEIERLVHTEGSFIANQATLKSYVVMGVEYYEYMAKLDNRTSEICRELDNKTFRVKDATAGSNYPPMHPWCRSTTVWVDMDERVNKDYNYAKEKGHISDNVTLKDYRTKREEFNSLIGENINGIEIKKIAYHAIDQSLNRGVSIQDVKDTIQNPLKITETVIKNKKPSIKIIGDNATVAYNPDTGQIATVYKMSESRIKKYKE